MTNPIIERAARALANGERIGSLPEGRHYRQARNVLRAIREPSINMLRAGEFDSGEPGGAWSITEDQAERVWQAMIDAALEDE